MSTKLDRRELAGQSPATKILAPAPAPRQPTDELADAVQELRAKLQSLEQRMDQLVRAVGPRPVLTRADVSLLTFALGIACSSRVGHNGEEAERLFSWCRQLQEKLSDIGANPS